jgi:putative spermidine/putrescine transport system permease protein
MTLTTARALVLLTPLVLVNAVAFVWPAAGLVRMSFLESTGAGTLTDRVTAGNYVAFMTDPASLELAAQSLWLSGAVTAATLVCSYPLALFLHRAPRRWQAFFFALTIAPLLVSSVVRTYGWMALLGDQGPVNDTLRGLGLVAQPVRLVNGFTGVWIGLVEILMPYMTLSLLAGFGRLDRACEEAAASLGAGAVQRFRRIVFPLTLPGVALGCGLCFVLTMSSFITPKLLGGGRVFLLATEIYDLALGRLQWPMAATMAVIVLVALGAGLALAPRLVRRTT